MGSGPAGNGPLPRGSSHKVSVCAVVFGSLPCAQRRGGMGGRGFAGQATEARATAPHPGPPLRLRRKGVSRSGSGAGSHRLAAPSLARSAGEGWGGVEALPGKPQKQEQKHPSPALPFACGEREGADQDQGRGVVDLRPPPLRVAQGRDGEGLRLYRASHRSKSNSTPPRPSPSPAAKGRGQSAARCLRVGRSTDPVAAEPQPDLTFAERARHGPRPLLLRSTLRDPPRESTTTTPPMSRSVATAGTDRRASIDADGLQFLNWPVQSWWHSVRAGHA